MKVGINYINMFFWAPIVTYIWCYLWYHKLQDVDGLIQKKAYKVLSIILKVILNHFELLHFRVCILSSTSISYLVEVIGLTE